MEYINSKFELLVQQDRISLNIRYFYATVLLYSYLTYFLGSMKFKKGVIRKSHTVLCHRKLSLNKKPKGWDRFKYNGLQSSTGLYTLFSVLLMLRKPFLENGVLIFHWIAVFSKFHILWYDLYWLQKSAAALKIIQEGIYVFKFEYIFNLLNITRNAWV